MSQDLTDINDDLKKLDEAGLNNWVLTHIPELYAKFGQGWGKIDKINKILEYVLLYPDAERRIIDYKVQTQPDRAPDRLYEIANPHHFDLGELITDCLDKLPREPGLFGFALPCNSQIVLGNFCRRLEYEEWGSDGVQHKPILALTSYVGDRFKTPVEGAIQLVGRSYRPALANSDVLFAVSDSEVSMIDRFWQDLRTAMSADQVSHRMVVILGTSPGCTLAGLHSLNPPRFTNGHVKPYVRRVVETHFTCADREEIIDQWADEMIAECIDGDELSPVLVYGHLGDMLRFLSTVLGEHSPHLALRSEIERRRQVYVQA